MGNQQLTLDLEKVARARELARSIALQVQQEIDQNTTVSIERTVARMVRNRRNQCKRSPTAQCGGGPSG